MSLKFLLIGYSCFMPDHKISEIYLNVITVETHYNAVLRVHRSDPRYIRVDGYNAVFPTPRHAAHEHPVSAVDRFIL